jgi:serine protease inhibitor
MCARIPLTEWCEGVLRKAGVGILVTLSGLPFLAASTADQAKLVAADTGFAFSLLREITTEQPGRSIFISPYSISTVLQMVANGASGTTRAEMLRVLGTAGMEGGSLDQTCRDLDASVRSAQGDLVLTIANGIWYSVGIEVKPAFATTSRDFYGVRMEALDFTDPRTGGVVNRWVENHTGGRIRNIVAGRFPGDTSMVLANAIYFKGLWERRFDPKATKPRQFHPSANRLILAPMMEQSADFDYQEGQGYQAVRLPYKGGRLGMYVLLPDPGSNLSKLLGALDARVWQDQLVAGMAKRNGTVVLPRFKLQSLAELNQPLQAMGMKLPFSRSADFSLLASSPVFLSVVKHGSLVEVAEEGTEAAAATVAVMRPTSVRPLAQPFRMVVDRPFLFVIADQTTKAILFLGIVFDTASAP